MMHQHKKSSFHSHERAADFDRRAEKSDIRAKLGEHMIEALELQGNEWVLDIATGTGRFAKPVSQRLTGGKVIGVDEAMAMLSVAHEKVRQESLSRYHQAAGEAEGLPFQEAKFDRCFVAFSLHHFKDPALMVKESLRVLKPHGRLVVLDPVVVEPQDNIDHSIHEVVNRVFGHSHGGVFRFHTANEIEDLLKKAGFEVSRADLHQAPFDQDGMEGIPTGRHWLEAAEQLESNPEMRKRFAQNYFQFWKNGDQTHVKGRFHFALICGDKP